MKLSFNTHKIIKIAGKTFNELNLKEVGLMISADSSISPDGNEYFSSCALDEFLHNSTLSREDLISIRREILENIYLETDDPNIKEINRKYLLSLSRKLLKSE